MPDADKAKPNEILTSRAPIIITTTAKSWWPCSDTHLEVIFDETTPS